jgi:hypothetical protein
MPEKANKLMPALYGGVIMGVISGIPGLNLLNCLCCAGILFGGFMAVFFYKKELTEKMPPLSSGDAVAVGALSGVFGAIVGSLLTALVFAAVGNIAGEMAGHFLDRFRDQMPPGTFDQFQEGMRFARFSIFHFFMSLFIDVIFGLLGGLIGYAVFKPKAAAMVPPPPPAPPR